MKNKILQTENEAYGFYGTIHLYNTNEETDKKWNEAFKLLLELSGKEPEEIRTYLDSRSGRKLADSCNDNPNEDLKNVILKEYVSWVEYDLFECRNKKLTNENRILFGQQAHDDVNNKNVIILYEGKIQGLNGDYLKVIDINENKYIIKRDFVTPIE